MKKIILNIAVISLLAILLTGCPSPLTSIAGYDLMVSLGRNNSSEQTQLYAAVGGSFVVPVTVSNQNGETIASDCTIVFTLSDDDDFSTTDDNYLLLTETIIAGEDADFTLSLPPGITTAATRYLFAEIDCEDDTITTNNTSRIALDVGTSSEPDLALSLKSPYTEVLYGPAEGSVKVSYSISNEGYGTLSAGTIIKLDLTVSLDGSEVFLYDGSVTLSEELYPQDYISGTFTADLPAEASLMADNAETTFSGWIGFVTGTVNSSGDISESSTANNTDKIILTVCGSLPDLHISEINFSEDFSGAWVITDDLSNLVTSVTVENDGWTAARGYTVVLFQDTNSDGEYDSGDIDLYTWDAPGTVPYDFYDTSNYRYLLVPADTRAQNTPTAGNYYLGAAIIGSMAEGDTSDNTYSYSSDVTFFEKTINLTGTVSSSSSGNVADGSTVTYTATITNDGDGDVDDDFTVTLYSSEDNYNARSSNTIYTTTVSGLGVGESKTITYDFSNAEGNNVMHWVSCKIDTGNAIPEIDEDDNTSTSTGIYFYDDENSSRTYTLTYRPFRTSSTNTNNFYMYFVLYDENGTALSTASCSTSSRTFVTALSPGIYYLKVYSYVSNSYGMFVSPYFSSSIDSYSTPFESYCADNSKDEYEDNDSSMSSGIPDKYTDLNFGKAYNRYINGSSDYEWYKVVLP